MSRERPPAPHRLVVFLTALARCESTAQLHQVAAEVLAEEYDAEIAAVATRDEVLAAVGFGHGKEPKQLLLGLRPGTVVVDMPVVGPCQTMTATWGDGGTLSVGRVGGSFSSADREVLLGMAGSLALAAGALRALEDERRRLRNLEVLLAVQRAISHRAPLKEILQMVTEGASTVLDGLPVVLELRDDFDPSRPVRVGAELPADAPHYEAAVHIQGAPAGFLRAASRPPRVIRTEDQALLSTFAEHASLALTDAKTVAAMREAFHDPLTGLPNRPLFLDRLNEALLDRTTGTLSVLFIDLDRFKGVNDTLGHAAGDELLLDVASRIVAHTRHDVSAARFGGDEFAVVVVHEGDPSVPQAVAERIIHAISEPFTVYGKTVVIGATVGIAHARLGTNAAELLSDADLAMYHAKAAGGGRAATFVPQMREALREKLDFEADLAGAMARDELHLEFQPIVDLVTLRPVAVEALLRWTHPSRGNVPPAKLVPVAEETGLIVPIGRWVLEEACATLREWRDELPHLRMAVNVSVHQLRDPAFAQEALAAVAVHQLRPEDITIEVTESALIVENDDTVATLKNLSAHGFLIAFDDFGTGFSSLGYLQGFPVDALKIDRSFVSGARERKGGQLVRTVIDLGKAYGLEVIAEGIEDRSQLSRLVDAGCVLGQGFLLGKPARKAQALTTLKSQGWAGGA